MINHRFITALLGAAVLAACSKDGIQSISAPATGAYVKFYNFGINAPAVNFFANDSKVTAVSSTSCTPVSTPPNPLCTSTGVEATTGTASGALGNGGLYSSIPAGQYSLTGRIATATDNGLAVAKLSTTIAAGKYYSFYTSGFYDATAKTVDGFIIEDAVPTDIDFTKSTVRFVNASPNASAMTLYAKNTVTGDSVAIGSAVAYKSGGTFVTLPPGAYDLTVRAPGSNTALIVRTAVSFSLARVYTVSARGDMTVTSTTAATRPQLDNTANR